MAFGIDYAWGSPDIAKLKLAGVKFVCRYVSTPGNSKNITKGEVVRYKGAGIALVIVFETVANRALSGKAGGVQDAKSARNQLLNVGLPATTPVYFAVDWDASEAQQPFINSYLKGAASVLGVNNVGVYGGYYVVSRSLSAGVCKYGWQTYAWSGGQWDKNAHIQQYRNGQKLAGVSCDFDRNIKPDFGQHPEFLSPTPPPKPKPVPGPPKDGQFIYLKDKDGQERWEPLTKRGILLRSGQFASGKYREVRFKRTL